MRFSQLCLSASVAAALGVAVSATSGLAAQAPAAVDRDFLVAAHQINLTEIATAKDAEKSATDPCVKSVAAHFVSDHRRLDAGVVSVARKLHVSLPNSMPSAQRRDLDALKRLARRPAYNTTWLGAQSSGHEQALRIIDKELASGKDPQAKALAREARTAVARHLALVRGGKCRRPGAKTPATKKGRTPAKSATPHRG